jgi:hypothetical protein
VPGWCGYPGSCELKWNMDALINERVTASAGFGKSKVPGRIELVSVQVRDVLNLRRLPARLTVQQTAALLNCGEHDIPVLVCRGLLKPLGHPPANAVKYFAPTDVLELAGDSERMGRICDAIYKHWRDKNAAKADGAHGTGSRVSGAGVAKREHNGVEGHRSE